MSVGDPDQDRTVPPGARPVGSGWLLQARPRDQDRIEVEVGDGRPTVVKQITRDACRLLLAAPTDSSGRSPALRLVARSSTDLVEWAAVSVLTPDGGLKRLVRGVITPNVDEGLLVFDVEAADLPAPETAFVVLQLAAAAEGRFEILRMEEIGADQLIAGTRTADAKPAAATFRALFDPEYYAAQAGTALAGETPFAHYRRTRGLLGFDPHPLFDTGWYLSRLSEPLARRDSPLAHYWRVGDRMGLSPHPLFDPFWYRSQDPLLDGSENALLHFLHNGAHEPRRPHPTFAPDLYTDRNPDILIRGVNPLVDHLSRQRSLPPQAVSPLRSAEDPDARIVVYTCLFGGRENLKPVHLPAPGVRYIAFTDQPDLTHDVWEIVRVTDRLADARRTSRLPKILTHLYLPAHDVAIYVDASFEVSSSDIRAAVEDGLEGRDLGLYRHHKRRCVYDELDLCVAKDLEDADQEAVFRSLYDGIGIAPKAGLFENGVIFRRNTLAIAALNERWWRHHLGFRDQLSFMPALVESGVRVNPIRAGDQVRRNAHFRHIRHERPPLSERGSVYAFALPEADFESFLDSPTAQVLMAALDPADCALFLQEGYGLPASGWPALAARLAGDADGALVVGRSNTALEAFQRLPSLVRSDNALAFRDFADAITDVERDWQVEVTGLGASLAPVMLVAAGAWISADAPPLPTDRPVRLALSLVACDRRFDHAAEPRLPVTGALSDRPRLTCIVHEASGLTAKRYADRLSALFDLSFVDDGFGAAGSDTPTSADAPENDFTDRLDSVRRVACCSLDECDDADRSAALVRALTEAGHAVTWRAVAQGATPAEAGPKYFEDEAALAADIARHNAVFPLDLILLTGPTLTSGPLFLLAEERSIPLRSLADMFGHDPSVTGELATRPVLEALGSFRFADRPGARARSGLGGLAGVLRSPPR